MPKKPLTYQEFERLFKQVRKEKRDKRRDAERTLTPDLLRHHIAFKKPLPIEFGVKPDGTPFTVKDLKEFAKKRKYLEKRYGKGQQGLTVKQIWDRTLRVDRQRSIEQIRNATLYRIENNLLKFRVSASSESKFTYHQVLIKLEEWGDKITSTKSYPNAVKEAVYGRISIECDCGRHQYWYRYLCGILNCGIKPLERAFPKIRNPKLRGICCKHVVKVLANLSSPAVQNILANEMAQQAKVVGFGDDKKTTSRFLKEDEQKSATASRADVKKAYDKYLKDRDVAAKMKQAHKQAQETEPAQETKAKYKAEKKGRKMTPEKDKVAAQEAMRKSEAKKERERIAVNMRPFFDQMKAAGLADAFIVTAYATAHGKNQDEISEIGKEFGIIK